MNLREYPVPSWCAPGARVVIRYSNHPRHEIPEEAGTSEYVIDAEFLWGSHKAPARVIAFESADRVVLWTFAGVLVLPARCLLPVGELRWCYGPSRQPCPYCAEMMECDEVGVGVGCVQCGPYYCMTCGASEIGPEWSKAIQKGPEAQAEFEAGLRPEERRTHFYRDRHSPFANTVFGTLVSAEDAKRLYSMCPTLLDATRRIAQEEKP